MDTLFYRELSYIRLFEMNKLLLPWKNTDTGSLPFELELYLAATIHKNLDPRIYRQSIHV